MYVCVCVCMCVGVGVCIGKLLPFLIINFMHVLHLFQVLSSVKQTRISRIQSVRKALPFHSSRNLEMAWYTDGIHPGSFDTKSSLCFSVNLKAV